MAKTILYIVDPKYYFKRVISILKKTINKSNIIYVTTNKPYAHLMNEFKKNNVNTSKFFIIDCITKYVGQPLDESVQNCIFLDNPQALTTISIAMNESIKQITGKKILFLDSLSTLLIYNDAKTMAKFSNFIINQMRTYNVDLVIFALESDVSHQIVTEIQSFVDEVKK